MPEAALTKLKSSATVFLSPDFSNQLFGHVGSKVFICHPQRSHYIGGAGGKGRWVLRPILGKDGLGNASLSFPILKDGLNNSTCYDSTGVDFTSALVLKCCASFTKCQLLTEKTMQFPSKLPLSFNCKLRIKDPLPFTLVSHGQCLPERLSPVILEPCTTPEPRGCCSRVASLGGGALKPQDVEPFAPFKGILGSLVRLTSAWWLSIWAVVYF